VADVIAVEYNSGSSVRKSARLKALEISDGDKKKLATNIYAMSRYDCFFLLEPIADLYSAIRLCQWETRPTKAQPLP
jgi:hypothetical protein